MSVLFYTFLSRNTRALDIYAGILKFMIRNKYVHISMKKHAINLSMNMVINVLPLLFKGVIKQAATSPSLRVADQLQKTLGYALDERLSTRQKIAIHTQLIEEIFDCNSGKCTLTLLGEGPSPYETIYCTTCQKNICLLEVSYDE